MKSNPKSIEIVDLESGFDGIFDPFKAPSMEKSGIERPKITKETVDLLHSNWEILVNRYEWQFSENRCVLFFYKFYYFIMGLLVVLCLTIPFLLFELLVVVVLFCFYILSFGLCRRSLGYETFGDYYRTFLGNSRIYLCSVPKSKHNILWLFGDMVIMFFQFVDIVKEGLNHRLHFHMKDYQRLFGPVFPFLQCICVSNYQDCYDVIHDMKSQRDYCGVGWNYSKEMEYYLLTHVFANNDARHEIARDIIYIITQQDSNDPNDASPMNLIQSTKKKLSKSKLGNEKGLKQAYMQAIIWYYICDGTELTTEELELVSPKRHQYVILPSWLQFLFGYNAGLRKLYFYAKKYGELFRKKGGKKYKNLVEYCNKHSINIELALLSVGIQIIFPNIRHASDKIIDRSKKHPIKEKKFFDSNNGTYNYVKEISRHHPNGIAIYNPCSEEKTFTIKGKVYKFPIGTIIGGMPTLASHSSLYFDDPDEFDPNRNSEEFDYAMSFAVLDKYHDKSKYNIKDISLRYCPARHFALRCLHHCARDLAAQVQVKEEEVKEEEKDDVFLSMMNSIGYDSQEKITVKKRLTWMFVPIKIVSNKKVNGSDDYETKVLVRPEAFRMLFYLLWFFYMASGILVSTYLSDTFDENDNLVRDFFGANNLCIYFDDKPFTYISVALWIPLMICLLLFEFFDAIRIYDSHLDGDHDGKCFHIFYVSVTIYECISIIAFVQIFAVTPYENIYVHTLPYILLIFALWTLALKRYLYFRKSNNIIWQSRTNRIGGAIYLITLLLSAIYKTFIGIIPNLFGAKLWQRDGWEWYPIVSLINERLYTFCVIACPLIIYYKYGYPLRILSFVINRHKME